MKKTIALLAGLVAGSTMIQALELTGEYSLGYESDYVFRGVRLGDEHFFPAVKVQAGDYYAGVWAALPLDKEDMPEIDYYLGYGVELDELASLDFGVTYYTYPDISEETLEFYAGVAFDIAFSPAVYVFYDIDLEVFTIDASGVYSIEAGDNATVDLSGRLGYVDPDENTSLTEGYFYYEAGADYVFSISDNMSASVGVRYYGSDAEAGLVTDSSSGKFTLRAGFSGSF